MTFGREITDVPSCETIVYDDTGKIIWEEKNDHFSSMIQLLIFNQFLYITKHNKIGFIENNPIYEGLISKATFRIRVRGQFDLYYSDYNLPVNIESLDKQFDCDQYAKDYDDESEMVDKIKINSVKLLTIFVRNESDLVMKPQNLLFFLPSNIKDLDFREM